MNINDGVKAILTDDGLEVYREFYRKVKSQCDNLPYWDGHIDRTDHSLETSMWHLIEIFGPATNMTAPILFALNEIEILNGE